LGHRGRDKLFTVELWTGFRLVKHNVLFIIRLMTREVNITSIVPDPGEKWVASNSAECYRRGGRVSVGQRLLNP
jgi:hypothetical protein